MHSILFQLKKPLETEAHAHAQWQQAATDVSKNIPIGRTDILAGEGFLLLSGENAVHYLAPAITLAVNARVPYKITFFEKASEWNCDELVGK
jgi:hypothetical protein